MSATLTDDDVMLISRHKGKRLRDVPNQTLGWLWRRHNGAGFCAFGERQGYPGQLADYIEQRFKAKRAAMPEHKWPQYLREGFE